MNERWTWLVRYVVVILLALVLAAMLGEMQLFKATKLGKTGVNAAGLVQFLGYGGALFVFWLFAQRTAAMLPGRDPRWNILKSVLVPIATLLVVSVGHGVLLLVLGPLMNKGWHQAYDWVFITLIILSAAWLVAALFTGSSSIAALFGPNGRAARQP
jgi:type IV secretory pathway VirB2 component (pilin)